MSEGFIMKTIFVTADNDTQFRHLCANFNLDNDSNRLIRVRRIRDISKYAADPDNTIVMTPADIEAHRRVMTSDTAKKKGRSDYGELVPYSPYDLYNGAEASQVVRELIDYNYMSGNTARDYAAMVHLSLTYMCRIFRRENNISIGEYITKVRLENAGVLLIRSNRLVKDVARMVGYPNFSYFCKRFKDYYHMTPAEYRRVNRLKKRMGETSGHGQTESQEQQ